MRKYLSILILLFNFFPVISQEIILDVETAVDTIEPRRGPNYKHYAHAFMGFGALTQTGSPGGLITPGLDQFHIGTRYKLKLNETFSTGWEWAYTSSSFKMKQTGSKITPDSFLYDKQRMIFYNGRIGGYVRINFGRRGNTLGKYLDLAAYGEYVFAHTLYTKITLADASVLRIRQSKLDYFQRFNYGVEARIGFGKVILYGNYRLSDMFYKPYGFVELPRLAAGIQFVLG
jgi:hypothetical protein